MRGGGGGDSQNHLQTELARPPKHIALNRSKIRLPLAERHCSQPSASEKTEFSKNEHVSGLMSHD